MWLGIPKPMVPYSLLWEGAVRTVGSLVARIPNCLEFPDTPLPPRDRPPRCPPPPRRPSQNPPSQPPPPPPARPRGLRRTVSWGGSWRPEPRSRPPPPPPGVPGYAGVVGHMDCSGWVSRPPPSGSLCGTPSLGAIHFPGCLMSVFVCLFVPHFGKAWAAIHETDVPKCAPLHWFFSQLCSRPLFLPLAPWSPALVTHAEASATAFLHSEVPCSFPKTGFLFVLTRQPGPGTSCGVPLSGRLPSSASSSLRC